MSASTPRRDPHRARHAEPDSRCRRQIARRAADRDDLPAGQQLRDAAPGDHQDQRRDDRLHADERDQQAVPHAASTPTAERRNASAERSTARTPAASASNRRGGRAPRSRPRRPPKCRCRASRSRASCRATPARAARRDSGCRSARRTVAVEHRDGQECRVDARDRAAHSSDERDARPQERDAASAALDPASFAAPRDQPIHLILRSPRCPRTSRDLAAVAQHGDRGGSRARPRSSPTK